MSRVKAICSGQYGDIALDDLCFQMSAIGYQALELAVGSHLDIEKCLNDVSYLESIKATFKKHNMHISAISAHLIGQCVGDNPDVRLNNFAPSKYQNQPELIRAWAIDSMKKEIGRAHV